MTISRRKPLGKLYQLNNTILDRVSSFTYLGVTISNTLSWSEQISTCTKKANFRLGFLRRNLKGCPQQLRRTGYISLIRSLTEYGAALWDPYSKKDINQLEVVQRIAAHQSPTTTEHRHSFVNHTIPEWNRLPDTMAEADSLSDFKSQLACRAD